MKLIVLLVLANIYASDFKKERTSYYSPLSYTINKIERERKGNININLKPAFVKSKISLFEKFKKENSKNKKWRIKISPFTLTPSMITGDRTSKKYEGDIEYASKNFIEENRDLLEVDYSTLKKVSESNFLGTSHIYYKQTYKGLDVEFSYVKVHRNQNNEITFYDARYYRDIDVELKTYITFDTALNIIKNELGNFNVSTHTLVIYPDDLNSKFYLAYKIEGLGGSGYKNGNWVYYIDAKTGIVLFKYDKRQYDCTLAEETTGTIKALVYPISPIPTGPKNSPWVSPEIKPLENLYVFVYDYQKSAITKSNGEYCYDYDSNQSGAKIFFTTLGPYFSVVDYNGDNIFYTNGNIEKKSIATSLTVPSYPPNSTLTYTVTPNLEPGKTLAFISPFFSSFNVGKFDEYGNSEDFDVVYIIDAKGNRIASWTGQNKSNFLGGYIPSSSYTVKLVSDEINKAEIKSNFSISYTTYIVITNPDGQNNPLGSPILNTSPIINTFYHLNKIRSFMMKFNSKCSNGSCIDLNKTTPVNVNVYAYGNTPMYNAYYDLYHDAIYIGRGDLDSNFAWDGTVIRHEYIHLVQNRVYPAIYFGEGGAIAEALSDYFSLSSLWDEGYNITIVGNFIDMGEGVKRDLRTLKKMPDDWVGEVHDDGMIISGVFYDLAKGEYSLGNFLPNYLKSDVLIFGALFYFPDSFEAFMEAMVDLCNNITECTQTDITKIREAFASHGIISNYAEVDPYEPNNGPAYATDISSMSKVYAYIDYPGDEDYYMLSLDKGFIHFKLDLPKHVSGLYHAYMLILTDFYGNIITYNMPPTNIDYCYGQEYPNACITRSSTNEIYYYIDRPGIYYIAVTAGLNQDETGPGKDSNRNNPYVLSYDGNIYTNIQINKIISAVDQDVFEFTIRVPKFSYSAALSKPWEDGEVFEFCGKDCFKMFDARMIELSKDFIEITDASGLSGSNANYYSTDSQGNLIIKGRVKFTTYNGQTFSQRYPYIGTVYFKFFAKNHMSLDSDRKTDDLFSFGTSDAVYLTGIKNEIITYNNIIDSKNKNMLIKLESATSSNIKVYVYTPTGTLVRKLYEGPIEGKKTVLWDGTDDKGKKLPSGIYYIKTEGAVNKVEKVGIVR